MKFGKAEELDHLDLCLPQDHPDTINILNGKYENLELYFGMPKWGKADLKEFYPRGTKDPLRFYSERFNAIEFNAFFYRIFPPDQVRKWYEGTTDDFKFYPKINQSISQFRRLENVQDLVDQFLLSVTGFQEKLGTCFLQMHPSFSPSSFASLKSFIESWPKDVELAVELRNENWFSEKSVSNELQNLLRENKVTHILTDTTGRRDMLHMRLTSPHAFVRFTAGNHFSDEKRIEDWADRIVKWNSMGLKKVSFFAHVQAVQEDTGIPFRFISMLNSKLRSPIKNG
ncbi:MAG: DUF72 domain-containing protein [Bacteroidetes bacterium]|nr:DUF72 domain-containing protein [Bacteroidota bacterium]